MKNIEEKLNDYIANLQHYHDKILAAQVELENIDAQIQQFTENIWLCVSGYYECCDNNFYRLSSDLRCIRRYLEDKEYTTSKQILDLQQILSDDTTSDFEEYIEEFEEMLSDGDIPF